MSKFLNLLVSGVAAGGIYSLIASGLVLTYTTTGVFNLAYAGVAFLSAYTYFELHVGLGWGTVPAALVVLFGLAPALGYLFERIFRPLRRYNDAVKVTASIGLLIALPAIAHFIVNSGINTFHWSIPTGDNEYFAPGLGPSPKHIWALGNGIVLDSNQVIVFSAAAACALLLWILLRHTSLGLRMRAVADSEQQAQLVGVNCVGISRSAWILGTVLAALAGVVAAPIFNSLDAATFTTTVFVATAACVFGGFRSVPWAFAGGLLLGVATNLAAGYGRSVSIVPGFADSLPFIVLLIGLVVLGRRRGRVGSGIAVSGDPPIRTDPTALADRWTKKRLLLTGSALAVYLIYINFVAGPYWLTANVIGLALALTFLSFVPITGMGGMLNLAPAAFVMTSALTLGLLTDRYHVPWLVAACLGVVAAMAMGLIVALPALRLGGFALALATLSLAFVADSSLFSWTTFTNGLYGWSLHRPVIGSVEFKDDKVLAMIVMAVIIVLFVAIVNLHRAAAGRAMFAVRNSEPGASSIGLSPVRVRLAIFVIGSAMAGIGGVVLATYTGNISSGAYPATLGLTWFAVILLWGVRRPGAALAAGMMGSLLPALLASGFTWPHPIPAFLNWQGTKSIYLLPMLFGVVAVRLATSPEGIFEAKDARRAARLQRRERDAELASQATNSDAVNRNGDVEESSTPWLPELTREVPISVELRGVRAGYDGVNVLADVDLSVPEGKITALVGANGAGKSTLCSVIAGLIPATTGSITFDGIDVTKVAAYKRAREGLVVAPENRGVFPGLTVEENLRLRLDAAGRNAVYERFPALAKRRNVHAGNLSGGEQQILALGSVLALKPQLVIADEPTLGLAPIVVGTLLEIFEELRQAGTTVVLVEEKAKAILEISDFVVLFELGRVRWMGQSEGLDELELLGTYLGTAVDPGDDAPRPTRLLPTRESKHAIQASAPLEARGVTVQYSGVLAVDDVSIEFASEQIVGVIGPNGAGKTTLLDCLSGLRAPTSGQVFIDGEDATGASASTRARMGIRRTFQRQQTFPWLTVADNVLVSLESQDALTGLSGDIVRGRRRRVLEATRRERVMAALDLCGLVSEHDILAGSLPLGRARLLEVARAIVAEPRLLLMDEPASGLDRQEADRLGVILHELRERHSIAVVLIEHDMQFVMRYCERLIVLNLGTVLADGAVDEIRRRPDVADAYLGERF